MCQMRQAMRCGSSIVRAVGPCRRVCYPPCGFARRGRPDPFTGRRLELLIAYLVLGSLVAIAQRDWRLGSLVRATVLWPARVPAMLRGDPSPPDPPALAAWEDRIGASLASLEQAIEAGRMLANAEAGRALVDTRADLVAIARRHAELEQVLEARAISVGPTALVRADPHQRPVLQKDWRTSRRSIPRVRPWRPGSKRAWPKR